MSRIVGIVGRSSQEDHHRSAEIMLRNAASRLGWHRAVLRTQSGSLGWTGWKEPATACLGHLRAVVDGMIFNRDELGQDGKYGSDAEVLLRFVERWGFAGTLARINGDFALAVLDEKEQALWLGRDRLGVKPLYHAMGEGFFAFASRPRALLALPGISRDVNTTFAGLFAGSHYRTFDNDPEASPYAAVSQVPAGSWLCLRDGRISRGRYWELCQETEWEESEEALSERYRELLMDAVGRRLRRADSPAFTLSGGMDSSSVLAASVRVGGSKQIAYSTVYADKTYDESDEIRSMLQTTVSEWRPVGVGVPDVFGLVAELVAEHDEPVATATWLSHALLCRQAANAGVRALFGGLGGDELNAGEYEHFLFHFADLRQAGKRDALAREVACWARHHDHPLYRKSMEVVEEGFGRLVDRSQPGRCLPDRKRLDRYAGAVRREYLDVRAFAPVMEHPFGSYLKNRTFQDMFRETAPCCLRAEDRQTTAVGMDHFDPFFDHRLIEFMFRVPGTMKIRDGVTKILLRKAMRGVLPEETRTRVKKTGWNAPAHVWFSGQGRLQLLELVNDRSFRERGIYDAQEVLRIVEEHERIVSTGVQAENHMMFLWQLVNLELWLRWLREWTPDMLEENPAADPSDFHRGVDHARQER